MQNRLNEQDVQFVFDAIEQYRKEHPEIVEAIRKYEETSKVSLSVQLSANRTTIDVSASSNSGGVIFSFTVQMASCAHLNSTMAWLLQLHRYVQEQGWQWIVPDVGLVALFGDDEKEIVATWKYGARCLSVWFDGEGVIYSRTSDVPYCGDAGDGKMLYKWLING